MAKGEDRRVDRVELGTQGIVSRGRCRKRIRCMWGRSSQSQCARTRGGRRLRTRGRRGRQSPHRLDLRLGNGPLRALDRDRRLLVVNEAEMPAVPSHFGQTVCIEMCPSRAPASHQIRNPASRTLRQNSRSSFRPTLPDPRTRGRRSPRARARGRASRPSRRRRPRPAVLGTGQPAALVLAVLVLAAVDDRIIRGCRFRQSGTTTSTSGSSSRARVWVEDVVVADEPHPVAAVVATDRVAVADNDRRRV